MSEGLDKSGDAKELGTVSEATSPAYSQCPQAFPELNPVVGTCPKCGITLHEVMHYVCRRPGCPTGLSGPIC